MLQPMSIHDFVISESRSSASNTAELGHNGYERWEADRDLRISGGPPATIRDLLRRERWEGNASAMDELLSRQHVSLSWGAVSGGQIATPSFDVITRNARDTRTAFADLMSIVAYHCEQSDRGSVPDDMILRAFSKAVDENLLDSGPVCSRRRVLRKHTPI